MGRMLGSVGKGPGDRIWSGPHVFPMAESKANCKVGEGPEDGPGRSEGLYRAAEPLRGAAQQAGVYAELGDQVCDLPGTSPSSSREELGFSPHRGAGGGRQKGKRMRGAWRQVGQGGGQRRASGPRQPGFKSSSATY